MRDTVVESHPFGFPLASLGASANNGRLFSQRARKRMGLAAEVEWPHATKGKGALESECALVKVRS
jgi:hypothetical protein